MKVALFTLSYRGYPNKYADGVFWEGGLISGGGVLGFEAGGGFDVPLQNNLTFRVGAGIVVVDNATAFGARGGVYYSF